MDRRQERPRADAVHPDAVAGVLDRGDLRELDHRGLGGAVGRSVRPRGQPRDRGGQHDRPRTLRAHHADRRLDAVHRAEDVDAEGPLPVLGLQVVDATVRRQHPGVADQHVEATEPADGQVDHRRHLIEVAHVGQRGLDRAAGGVGQAGGRGLEGRRAEVAQHEVGVGLSGEPGGQRGAERAACARDHHDPTCCCSGAHTSRYPPSTVTTVPVTNADASEARNW